MQVNQIQLSPVDLRSLVCPQWPKVPKQVTHQGLLFYLSHREVSQPFNPLPMSLYRRLSPFIVLMLCTAVVLPLCKATLHRQAQASRKPTTAPTTLASPAPRAPITHHTAQGCT